MLSVEAAQVSAPSVGFHRMGGDLAFVRRLFTLPEIYPSIGDDFSPPREEFQPNARLWYVAAFSREIEPIGIFTLVPQNRVCWELHVVMVPWAGKREKWAAGRQLLGWIRDNTGCRRLTAAVPAYHRRAIAYGTHVIGMHYVGRQQAAFQKNGELHDLVLLGVSV